MNAALRLTEALPIVLAQAKAIAGPCCVPPRLHVSIETMFLSRNGATCSL